MLEAIAFLIIGLGFWCGVQINWFTVLRHWLATSESLPSYRYDDSCNGFFGP